MSAISVHRTAFAVGLIGCLGGGVAHVRAAVEPQAATPNALTGWTTVASYPLALAGLAASTNGTFAFVAGGWDANGNPTNAFNRYDPVTNSWTSLAPLPTALSYSRSTYSAVNNKVYVFGGLTSACNYFNTTYIYDVSSNTWTTGAPMPAARFSHAVVYYAPTAKIYVIGGWKELGPCVIDGAEQTWEYDPIANTWNTSRANIPVGMADSAASSAGQFIYLAGSANGNNGTTLHYRYDIVNNAWAVMAPLPVAVRQGVGAAIGGETHVVGGGSGATSYNTTYIYNIASNSWRSGPPTNVAHYGAGGTAVGGRLLIVGGHSGTSNTIAVETATSDFLGTGLLVADAMSIGYAPNNYGYLATNLVTYTFANSRLAASEFAIFQTHDPWGNTVVKNAITSASHTFNVFTPAQLSGFNFSAYRVVILNWDDHVLSDFMTPYSAALTALQNYVRSGGVLWVQASIQGVSGDMFPTPFGGLGTWSLSTSNDVVDPLSPLAAGAPNPITGNYASQAAYSGLPGGAHRIVTQANGNGPPTLYEFRLRRVAYDTNRDLLTDRTVFRPGSGVWYTALSTGGGTATAWGLSTDIDVMGDYDGDGKADVAVFRPSTGQWCIVQSTDGSVRLVVWGTMGDVPLAGDYDGDGKDDLVVYRNGSWYVYKSGGGTGFLGWGTASDQPLLADIDGDGKLDPVVFRPSNGFWFGYLSGGSVLVSGWGTTGDVPLPQDFDGDGKADMAVFRPSSGQWFVSRSTGGSTVVTWGATGDIPVSGDWDGDGRADFAVWRPSSGTWYTLHATGSTAYVAWGTDGDRPSGRLP